MANKPVSLAPESFVAGGMLDDVDVRVLSATFQEFDYNGQADEPVCALCLELIEVDGKTFEPVEDAEARSQYYSCGGTLAKFTPSADRTHAVPAKEGTALGKQSNAALLFNNLVNAGFPSDRLVPGDISVLNHAILHVNQIAAPKRSGGDKKFEQKEGKTILLPTKVLALPEDSKVKGAKKASGAATSAAGKPNGKVAGSAGAPTSAPAADGDASDAATEIVLGILGEKPALSKTALNQEAFKKGARGGVMALIAKTEWLGDADRPWTFKDGQVSAS